MAIDPSKSTPSDAATVSSLQSTTEASAKAAMRAPIDSSWGNARSNFVTNIISGIGQALLGGIGGIFQPISDGMKPIRDAQLDLLNRTELLEGVQGYAHAYMTKNVNAQWSLNNNWRTMPFDGQVGPSVGATVRSDGRVEMGSKGLWLIYAKTHGRSTGFTGDGGVTMRVNVYRPDGSIYSSSYVRGTSLVDAGAIVSTYGNVSLVAVVPVVIDEPGCYVRVDTWTAAWRWWDGGTQLSSLSVVKQSSNTENKGSQTVPDETESEATK